MFENLTDKLEQTFKRLRGHGRITEANVAESLREVRLALLEADVNFKVVKSFIDSVQAQSMGQDVLQSLTPDQQLIKIVKEELVKILGGEAAGLDLKGRQPVVLMLVGLQGSGKTTTAVKLALHLKKQQKRTPYLVSADVYRPAAREQLRTLCDEPRAAGVRLRRQLGAGGDLPQRLRQGEPKALRRADRGHRRAPSHRRGVDAGAGGDSLGPGAAEHSLDP